MLTVRLAVQLNGAVYVVRASPDGSRLLVGGDFTVVDGTSTGALVAGSQYDAQVLDETDLGLDTFHLSKYAGDCQVLEVIGDRVYAGCHCRQDTRLASAPGVLWAGTPPAGQSNAPVFAESPNSWIAAFDATTGLHIDAGAGHGSRLDPVRVERVDRRHRRDGVPTSRRRHPRGPGRDPPPRR